jgi:hypothetical protein
MHPEVLLQQPVSRQAVRVPCCMPNGSVRPKGGRGAAAALTEPVSRFLNLRDAPVLDPCRRPNGSVRLKGDRGAAAAADRIVQPVSRQAVRVPCRMPNGSVRPKGGRGAAAARTKPVSRFLNLRDAAVLDPCRRPNGSVRPKGDRGAAAVARTAPSPC